MPAEPRCPESSPRYSHSRSTLAGIRQHNSKLPRSTSDGIVGDWDGDRFASASPGCQASVPFEAVKSVPATAVPSTVAYCRLTALAVAPVRVTWTVTEAVVLETTLVACANAYSGVDVKRASTICCVVGIRAGKVGSIGVKSPRFSD
jgi:hypothetical protein